MRLRSLVPPAFASVHKALRRMMDPEYETRRTLKALQESSLFDGDDALFKQELARCRTYGEIGLGQSTVFAARQANLERIVAVDSSAEWISLVRGLVPPAKVELRHVDFGPLTEWGRPEGYAHIDRIDDYALGVLAGGFSPDLILVDGRFRVYVCARLIQEAAVGAKIILDDYSGRPFYHILEELVRPAARHGRQALFEVTTGAKAHPKLQWMIDSFRFVMD